MARILGLFLGLVLFTAPLFAPPEWKQNRMIDLGKDEFLVLNFKIGEVEKRLYFRWTMLKNEGLVMHLNYDFFPHQFILYRDYQRACYRQNLFGEDPRIYSDAPYFMLCFKEYHRVQKRAWLKFYLYAGGRDINIVDERKVPNAGFGAN